MCTDPNAVLDEVVFIPFHLALEAVQFGEVSLIGSLYPLLVDGGIGVGGSERSQIIAYCLVLLHILSILQDFVCGKLQRIHS